MNSFLIEITGKALQTQDPETGQAMVDMIVDQAGQKGTGRWTVIEALKLGQSASAIEGAVGARAWSSERMVRASAEAMFSKPSLPLDLSEDIMEQALRAGRILSHAQGFRILQAASEEFDWSLDLAQIAEIWRAGCIIRSALLDDLANAFRADPPLGHVILSPDIAADLKGTLPALRKTVAAAITAGLPVPALSGALQWVDSMSQARGTTNVIQAQRDFFGRHGFERTDRPGKTHAGWG